MRRTHLIIVTVLVAVGGLGAATAVRPAARVEGDAPRLLKVEAQPVSMGDHFVRTRRFTGEVVPARQSVLSFETGGELIEVTVDDGERVRTGQTLARLDTRRLDARKRRTAAEHAQAEAVLRELKNGERSQTIDVAKARVAELEAELKLAEARVRRSRQLVARSAATTDALDDAVAGVDATRARLESAQATLDELEEGARSERVDAQAALVDALAAAVAEIEAEVADATLKAPYTGRVTMRHADEGTVLAVGAPVLEIIEDGVLEIRVGLPVEQADAVSSGQAFEVAVGGKPVNVDFERLLPELNRTTRTRTAVLSVSDPVASVVAGRLAEVVVSERVAEAGFRVPSTALVKSVRGLWSVFVAVPEAESGTDDGDGETPFVVESRDVVLLHLDETRAYVRGTLGPGDRVVTSGTQRIVVGQRVRLGDH